MNKSVSQGRRKEENTNAKIVFCINRLFVVLICLLLDSSSMKADVFFFFFSLLL